MRSFLGAVVLLLLWFALVLIAGAWLSDYVHTLPLP